jgi:nucleoside-diphosphate-sugar epimerase
MTTLIVGCGYLGRRVARRLIGAGEPVIGTTRSAAWAASLAALGVEPLVIDVLDVSISQPPSFDRLVYCVGFDRSGGASMRSVYVDGLTRFLARIDRPITKFVYASSTGVYGQDDGSWVSEDAPTEPRHESGRVCLDAEAVARERGASVVRLAGLYGPGRIVRRAAILAGEPIIGDPDKVINLIQIDDAAAVVVAALDRGESGRITNVADDRPVSRRELYTLTASLLGAEPPVFLAPATDAAPAREEANRRIANQRMKQELGVVLAYPDVTTGLPASVAAERG